VRFSFPLDDESRTDLSVFEAFSGDAHVAGQDGRATTSWFTGFD